MAYDYTLQTKLQAPTAANKRKVNADIQRSFSSLSFNYNDRASKKAIKDIKTIGKAADDAGKKVKNFGDRIGAQGTSYLSYALVSGVIIRLTSAFAGATNEAIRFEKELIKIAQTTRKSNADIIKNARIITDISREYGLATNKVGELTRLLAQTGLSFRQAADGAKTLARTELLASFDNLKDTTEGLIALMNSFNLSTVDAAKGLEAINAVSKRFAVESGDIVEAIKRTGGAFSAAGGDINELIALFTSVRATSRESGETIATAFRTIFGRLQRPKTIDYFKELNIELADAQGNFVGGYAAIERISRGLNELGIRAGSIKFAEVAEQVGGIRQLSKVIPLLTKFSDAQDALAVANAAEAESEDDVAKAKKSLSFQIAQLTADFRALIFEITQTAGFKLIATLFIETARAAIDLTRALKPLIPLFAIIGAFKGFKIANAAFNKFQGVKNQAQGFNRGGPVPGIGNGDTVPAMLEPGEFVIRKSAVQAYGTQNLAKINKYGLGGKSKKTNKGNQNSKGGGGLGSVIRDQSLSKFYDINNSGVYDYQNVKLTRGKTPRSRDYYRDRAEDVWNDASGMSLNDGNMFILKSTGGFSQKLGSSELKESNTSNQRLNKIAGGLAEQDVFKSRSGLTKLKDSRGPDFLAPGGKYIEVKTNQRSVSNNTLLKKALLGTGQSKRGPFRNKRKDLVSPNLEFLQAFNKGGAVGTDTVPALLTPGEFVINQKSAQAFGYGKLSEINKYAKGGHVSRQKFSQNNGSNPRRGIVLRGGGGGGFDKIPQKEDGTADVAQIQKNTEAITNNSKAVREETKRKKIESKKRGTTYRDRVKQRYTPLDQQMLANKQGRNISSRRFDGVPSREEFISAKPSKLAGQDVMGGMSESGKKQAKAQKALTKETTKLKNGFSLSASSVFGFGLVISTVGGILESFGFEMNSVSAAQKKNSILLLSTAAALISYSAQIKRLGANLRGGKIQVLAKKVGLGGPAKKLGGVVRNLGKSIAKNGVKFAKGLSVLAALDIGGSLLAAFQGDASKTRDAAIKSGNAEDAGAAAVKAFGQELNNSIPIIGGFLNAFGANTFVAMISGLGSVVKASAELEATFVKNDKVFSESFKQLDKALAVGDSSAINEQVAIIASAAKDEKLRGENVLGKATSANRGSVGRDLGVGAVRGGLAGAATGATIGTFLGGPLGTLIGGGIGAVLGGVTGAITNLGSSSKVVAASATTAAKAFERFSENMIKAISSVSPAIDVFESKMIIAGASAEEAAAAVDKKFGGSIKNLGLLRSSEDIAKANKRLEETQKKLKEAQDRRTEAADDWFGNAEAIEDANIKALESEEKLTKERIAAGKASQSARLAAQALREEQLILNAVYRDAAKSFRLLSAELSVLDGKISDLDFARELTSTPFGATSGPVALRRRFGTNDLSGSLQQISDRDQRKVNGGGQLNKLVEQATRFVGPEAGKQVRQGILLQRAADTVKKDSLVNGERFSKKLDEGFQNFNKLEAKKLKNGSSDVTELNDRRRALAKDFLTANVFGGSIPAELEGQIDGVVNELSKAFEAGEVSAEQLSKIFENGGTKLSAQAVKGIQDQLGQQATATAELGRLNAKLFELKRNRIQAEYEQERKASETLNQIASDRINSLASAGASAESLRGARSKNLKDSRTSNLKSVLGSVVIPKGITSAAVRRKAKDERGALAKTSGEISKLKPTDQLKQDGAVVTKRVKAEAKLEDSRQASIQSLKNMNTVLAKDNELRKQGLDLQIEEANARRNQIQALNDAVGDLILEYGFGTDKQRSDLFEQSALAKSAISQGGLQGLTGDQRGAVGSFLDRFKGAGPLDILGGKTAAQVKGNFAAQEAVRGGLIKPSEFKKFADAAAKNAVPVEDRIKEVINSTYAEIEKSQKAINANEAAILASTFDGEIKKFATSVNKFEAATAKLFKRSETPKEEAKKKALTDAESANKRAQMESEIAKKKSKEEDEKLWDQWRDLDRMFDDAMGTHSRSNDSSEILKTRDTILNNFFQGAFANDRSNVGRSTMRTGDPIRDQALRLQEQINKVEHEVSMGSISVQIKGGENLKGEVLSVVLNDVGQGFIDVGRDVKRSTSQEEMGETLTKYGMALVEKK